MVNDYIKKLKTIFYMSEVMDVFWLWFMLYISYLKNALYFILNSICNTRVFSFVILPRLPKRTTFLSDGAIYKYLFFYWPMKIFITNNVRYFHYTNYLDAYISFCTTMSNEKIVLRKSDINR